MHRERAYHIRVPAFVLRALQCLCDEPCRSAVHAELDGEALERRYGRRFQVRHPAEERAERASGCDRARRAQSERPAAAAAYVVATGARDADRSGRDR